MDDAKLNYFKNVLTQKRNSLTGAVQRTENYGRENDEDARDITDMAVESYTKDFLFVKSAGDRRMLNNIEDALSRINNRSYSICANCGDEINLRRLEAVPWTTLCVKCQELREKN